MRACGHLGYQCAEEDIIDAVYCSHGDCAGEERHHTDINVSSDWAICCKDGARMTRFNVSVSGSKDTGKEMSLLSILLVVLMMNV